MIVLVDEFLEGGTLSVDDLTSTTLQDVGTLFGTRPRQDRFYQNKFQGVEHSK